MKRISIAVALTILGAGPTTVAATPGWIAMCENPKGPAVEYGDMRSLGGDQILSPEDGFSEIADGFTNVFPVFIYDGPKSNNIQFIWGDTKPDDIDPRFFREEKTHSGLITFHSLERVVMVETFPSESWITSLYPKAGVATASRHRILDLGEIGYRITASTYAMKCRFIEH
jgi:hypothetical protein